MTNGNHEFAEASRLSDQIVDRIRPMLGGLHPALQGIIVVELLAIWLAGHDPVLRDAMLKLQLDTLPELVELWHDRLRSDHFPRGDTQ
jgi:hypothetical protein